MALDDEVRREVQRRFEEVAKRANRLKEWMEFQDVLRKLDRGFGTFIRKVRLAVEALPEVATDTLPSLSDSWRNFQDTDLADLKSFQNDARFIREPLVPDAAGIPPGARLDVANLLDLCTKIRQDLSPTELAIRPLGDHCDELQQALNQQLASQRRAVQRELDELCERTIELRREYRPGNDGPPPAAPQQPANPND